MKHKELYSIHTMLNFNKFKTNPNSIDPLATIQHAAVLFALGYNKRLIANAVDVLEEARLLPDTFAEYEQSYQAIVNNQEGFSDEEVDSKLTTLKETYPDLSKRYDEHSKTFAELLGTEVTIEFKIVNFSNLTKADGTCAITKEQLDLLDFMIEYV